MTLTVDCQSFRAVNAKNTYNNPTRGSSLALKTRGNENLKRLIIPGKIYMLSVVFVKRVVTEMAARSTELSHPPRICCLCMSTALISLPFLLRSFSVMLETRKHINTGTNEVNRHRNHALFGSFPDCPCPPATYSTCLIPSSASRVEVRDTESETDSRKISTSV